MPRPYRVRNHHQSRNAGASREADNETIGVNGNPNQARILPVVNGDILVATSCGNLKLWEFSMRCHKALCRIPLLRSFVELH